MSFFKHERALVSTDAKIGKDTRIWANANILAGALVGEHCNICDGCFIEKGGVLGNHVTLKNNVCIFDGVTLEDDVFVGAGTTFINDKNPRSNRQDPWTLEKTLVKRGASLGANATIMCGITIGQYAVVGAGSVVTKNIPDYTIVVGNPAHFAGFACRCGRKMDAQLKCSCGACYHLINHTVVPI